MCGRKGTSYSLPRASEGRSGCERISPDPLGYGATQQIGRNLTLIYPTLGLGPGHVPQRSDIFFFPMEGIWRDLNPGPLDSRGFRRGGLDVSGFRRIPAPPLTTGPPSSHHPSVHPTFTPSQCTPHLHTMPVYHPPPPPTFTPCQCTPHLHTIPVYTPPSHHPSVNPTFTPCQCTPHLHTIPVYTPPSHHPSVHPTFTPCQCTPHLHTIPVYTPPSHHPSVHPTFTP